MKLEGMHDITTITGDAQQNADFYASVYFRAPQGILLEIAATSAGFAMDEDPEHPGEELRLPTQHEHRRPQLERLLTPLANPRGARRAEELRR